MLGLVVLVLAGGFALGGFVCGRYAFARARGIRGLRAAIGFDAEPWRATSVLTRLLLTVSGLVGYYTAIAIWIAIALSVTPSTIVDETSMRVTVAPGGPAASAGMLDGDRVISVQNKPISNWSQLKDAVGAHPDDAVSIVVERGGSTRELHVTPHSDGTRARISASPYTTVGTTGIGEALATGFVAPIHVWSAGARGLVRAFDGGADAEMTGPVGVVRETNRASQRTLGDAAKLAGALASYFFYVVLVASAILFPRPRKSVRRA